jgi:hypothetical protein
MKCSLPFTPRVSRVWYLKGHRGQRLVEAPGDNRKVYGFELLDWRDGWFDGRIAPGRTSDVFCEQVRAAVARSKEWACRDHHNGQSQDPYGSEVPARAEHADRTLRSVVSGLHLCL